MVCSVCKKAGHNKRTCIKKMVDQMNGISDEARDQFIECIAEQIEDEALAQAVELGLDMVRTLGCV